MTPSQFIAVLKLPASCRVDQRVPKKMLVENGARTAADKRLLNDVIEEIQWIAVLKPNTVGVPDYRDEHRDYLEVVVLSIATRGTRNAGTHGEATAPDRRLTAKPVNTVRLAELVHRAVPYAVLLLLATPQGLFLSAAHKRWAQNETAKVVLDGEVVIVEVGEELDPEHPFLQSVALTRQPQATLMTLYQGWMDCLTALMAARYTGTFKVVNDQPQAAERKTALRECQRLEQEAGRLRAQAAKEKQMAKLVDLNLALKRIEADLLVTRKKL